MTKFGGYSGGGKTMRERRREIVASSGASAKRLSSGEWVVKDDQGRPIATGFDTEAEADAWIASQ